jgi:predicted 2-oxoglutarate/Fe(II)-dependent dioxygenase YbiX
VSPAGLSGTHAVRYQPGDYYAPHTDTGADLLDRYFTVLCYLNDDFEGGETRFPQIGYSVAPRRGKAVVFPATYLHQAGRVTSGEKYVIVSWLAGRPPIKWI